MKDFYITPFGDTETKEAVLDCRGKSICVGMYVISDTDTRQGTIVDLIDDDGEGHGRIKVSVCKISFDTLKEPIITDFEPAQNWNKAIADAY